MSPVELQGHLPITSRIGLFVFAWTGVPTHIPWIAPLLSTVPYGAGTVLLFLGISVRPLPVGCLSGRNLIVQNYLVDTYLMYAASVLAAGTVFRSIFGVGETNRASSNITLGSSPSPTTVHH